MKLEKFEIEMICNKCGSTDVKISNNSHANHTFYLICRECDNKELIYFDVII